MDDDSGCAIRTDGGLTCWGGLYEIKPATLPTGVLDVNYIHPVTSITSPHCCRG
jgi:hypothetical protein